MCVWCMTQSECVQRCTNHTQVDTRLSRTSGYRCCVAAKACGHWKMAKRNLPHLLATFLSSLVFFLVGGRCEAQ